jgi:hypothetical protein
MKKGRAGTITHDYERHGVTTLFAALDVLEGYVIGQCMKRSSPPGVHPLTGGQVGSPNASAITSTLAAVIRPQNFCGSTTAT